MSSRTPRELDGYIQHFDSGEMIMLEDENGTFGRIWETTSAANGAKKAGIAHVELWGPDVLHWHKEAEETYLCLEGEGEMKVGRDICPFLPGYSVIIDPGTVHAAMPKSPCQLLRFLCISSPPFNPNDVFPEPQGRRWL